MQASKHLVISVVVLAVMGFFVHSGFTETAAEQQVVYENDFRKTVGSEWSDRRTSATPNGQREFLGEFGNNTVTLALDDLPEHSTVTLSFDLVMIRTWDGNHGAGDTWGLSVSDGPRLEQTTFSNFPDRGHRQAYPDSFPGGDHLAQTGADEVNSLGYGRDSIYRKTFSFAHSGHYLQLNFFASNLQHIADESWGLDNLRVCVGNETVESKPDKPETVESKADEPEDKPAPPEQYTRFEYVEVHSTRNHEDPVATGIILEKGQCFVLEPYPQDQWTGGGTKTGVYCDYMGYDDRGNNWMRLNHQIGDSKPVSVVSGHRYCAESKGMLRLFCHDGNINGNKGKIRVFVKLCNAPGPTGKRAFTH